VVSWKSPSKLSCFYLPLEKLVNEKHFLIKEKFGLVFRKVFSFYFERKTLSRSCEKIRNVILFIDYIKFGSQTFDCYIFCFESFFFQFHPLEFDLIWFFILTFGPFFMIVIYFSLIFFFIWNFLSIKFGLHSFYYYLFYLK
jgi:hypothetical protein